MSKNLTIPNEQVRAVQLVVFDFDGVFTDNTVWTNQQGEEMVRCWRSDGLGLSKLRAAGIKMFVLSTEANPVVQERCKKLGLPCRNNLDNKGLALRELIQEQELSPEQVLYLGNDINDLECLQIAGVSVVVADAHPEVVAVAQYQTSRAGGFGAVREVCDWVVANRV